MNILHNDVKSNAGGFLTLFGARLCRLALPRMTAAVVGRSDRIGGCTADSIPLLYKERRHSDRREESHTSKSLRNLVMKLVSFRWLKQIIVLLHVLIALNSCESYVKDFEIGNQPQKLVVNGLITPESIMVHLSKSFEITGQINIFIDIEKTDILVNDATVVLFENGVEIGELENIYLGYYTLRNFVPKVGVIYRIEAEAPDLPKVSAETVIPFIPETFDVEIVYVPNGQFGNNYFLEFNAKIGNYNKTKDFFGFSANILYDNNPYDGEYYSVNMNTSSSWIDFYYEDEDLKIHDTGEDFLTSNYFFASDNNHSSEKFSIKFRTSENYNITQINSVDFVVDFYDKNVYMHLLSIVRKKSSGDDLDYFEEKVSDYSNVKNGLGVFGAKNSCTYTFYP